MEERKQDRKRKQFCLFCEWIEIKTYNYLQHNRIPHMIIGYVMKIFADRMVHFLWHRGNLGQFCWLWKRLLCHFSNKNDILSSKWNKSIWVSLLRYTFQQEILLLLKLDQQPGLSKHMRNFDDSSDHHHKTPWSWRSWTY